jgi:MGT family glycosyltransferase
MARIGFLVFTGYGHTFPAVALAKALQARGHDVRCYLSDQSAHLAEGEDVPVTIIETPPRRPGSSYGSVLANFRMMIDITVDRLPDRIRRDGVELLVIDQSIISGRTVAERAGVPFVTLCTGLHVRRDGGRLPPFFTPWRPIPTAARRLRNLAAFAAFDAAYLPLLSHLNRRRRELGLRRHRRIDDTFSDRACLAALPAALEPAVDDGRPFHLIGPFVDVNGREASDERRADRIAFERLERAPILYISFGLDGRVSLDHYRAALEGSADLGFTRIVAAHGLVDQLKRFEDAATVVVSVAPQLAVLRRASIVVTHGGMNTVVETLLYGRPMLLLPLRDDQHGIAARIAWAGAGLAIPAKRVSGDRVREALRRLRDDGSYRTRALALAASITETGGLRRAADLVEEIALGPVGARLLFDRRDQIA